MTFAQKLFQSWSGRKRENNLVIFNCLAITLILITAGIYLFQINVGVNHCLEIERAEEQVKSLKMENEKLLKETAGLGSMANIAQIIQGLKMVKVDQVDYLVFSGEVLAEK
ncbi:hypothetical protein KKG58_03830 [Patescibacteria group bacterium]|nr:hypothetical protein [Patescibacteria group bacterium]